MRIQNTNPKPKCDVTSRGTVGDGIGYRVAKVPVEMGPSTEYPVPRVLSPERVPASVRYELRYEYLTLV